MTTNTALSSIAINSATTIEYQTPPISKIKGNSKTAAIWNTTVLKKDMTAEVTPSLRAVKNPEPKIA